MIPFKNTQQRYGSMAISLHWIMAILIIGMIIIGLYMVPLPVSPQKLKLYRWHKQTGIIILALACLRLGWRIANIQPSHSPVLPAWQRRTAKSVHLILYALMLLLPITGWFASSAAGFPVSFFGLFLLPDMVPVNEILRVTLIQIHHLLGFAIIGLICLHIGATFQHYIFYKENILRKMLP